MGVVKLRAMEDLVRWRADLRVVCGTCGREGRFDAMAMVRWFRSNGWSTSLDVAAHRFRCDGPEKGSGCGSRNARLSAIMPDPQMPETRPMPSGGDHDPVPQGVDPAAWAKASHYERGRLIRRARG